MMPCCNCDCHTRQNWLSILKRRSSCNSSLQSVYHESVLAKEEEELVLFTELYELAVNDIRFALEFHGSIYYTTDLLSAKETVDQCVNKFYTLYRTLNSRKAHAFHKKWSPILIDLVKRFQALPSS